MKWFLLPFFGCLLATNLAWAGDSYKLDIAAQAEGRMVFTGSLNLTEGALGSVTIPYGDPNTLMELKLANAVKDGRAGINQTFTLYNQDGQGRKTPLCSGDILSTVGKYAEILCKKRPNKPPLLIVIVNHRI